jgi:hypothetical protein
MKDPKHGREDWMFTDTAAVDDWTFARGADVVDARGERIGYVVATLPASFVFTHGWRLVDHALPYDAIAGWNPRTLFLKVAKAEALRSTGAARHSGEPAGRWPGW